VELTLNTLPSGRGVEGYLLRLFGILETARVLGGGATSVSSSTRASACSTHLTLQSNACSIDEPMVMTPFGPNIFILRQV
jgi:hypothetical protein